MPTGSGAFGSAAARSGRCPCGTGRLLEECCGPLLDGVPADTAEQLMRSRYTAFALGDLAHLTRSWHPATCPTPLTLDPGIRWTGLEVLATDGGGPGDDTGVVSFRAHHDGPDGPQVLAETSRFVRRGRAGRWVYQSPAG